MPGDAPARSAEQRRPGRPGWYSRFERLARDFDIARPPHPASRPRTLRAGSQNPEAAGGHCAWPPGAHAREAPPGYRGSDSEAPRTVAALLDPRPDQPRAPLPEQERPSAADLEDRVGPLGADVQSLRRGGRARFRAGRT